MKSLDVPYVKRIVEYVIQLHHIVCNAKMVSFLSTKLVYALKNIFQLLTICNASNAVLDAQNVNLKLHAIHVNLDTSHMHRDAL